jgi:hypothetical protein
VILGVVVSLTILAMAAVLSQPHAAANHIAGATYMGSHSGGGSVEFDVSGDGTGITRFRATDVPGSTCVFGEIEVNFGTPLPIEDHSFTRQVGTGLSFEGTFPSPGTANGTLRAFQPAIPFVQPACDSGTLNWDAATDAPTPTANPTPTPTQSPTPTPTTGPTPTPTDGAELTQGDNDCDGDEDATDALKTLQDIAAIDYNQEPGCPEIGGAVPAGEPPEVFGDVDCDGDVDATDALKLLQHIAAIPFNQSEPCTDIGDPF